VAKRSKIALGGTIAAGEVYIVSEWLRVRDIHGNLLFGLRRVGENLHSRKDAWWPKHFRLLHPAAQPSFYETQRELEDA
jgi:hypothetical protein